MIVLEEEKQLKNCLIRGIITYKKCLNALKDKDKNKGTEYKAKSYDSLSVDELIETFESTKTKFLKKLEKKSILSHIDNEALCKSDYDHIWQPVSDWDKNYDVISGGSYGHPESEIGFPAYYKEATCQCRKCKKKEKIRKYT